MQINYITQVIQFVPKFSNLLIQLLSPSFTKHLLSKKLFYLFFY